MTSKRIIQVRRMLAFADEHGSITNADAMYKLGIMSPTRRICDIEKLGYVVHKTWEKVIDRFGNQTQVKRYQFIKETKTK